MVLTIHIGNKVITLVGYEGSACVVSASLGTDLGATADQYAATIKVQLLFHKTDTDAIEGAVISSVVPALTHTLHKAVRLLTTGRVLTVGAGIKTGLDLRLDNAGAVGSDFICNAVAALDEFKPPMVILYMEGATTFTAIDENGAMRGRAILPGVETSLAHLCESAAMLPDVSFDPRAALIGRSTADAIRAGAFHGAVSMVEGMLARYTHALGSSSSIVATGEIAHTILPHCRQEEIYYRPQLLHDGMRLLYLKNQ